MIDWEEVLEPDDRLECEKCKYWDAEEGVCSEFVCDIWCTPLPCEITGGIIV